MAKDLNPPNSDAVVSVPDESVETYKAVGFTEVKASPKRSSASKSDK